MLASEQIVAFLKYCNHPNQRLVNWFTSDMEVQVLVAKDNGEPVANKNGVYCSNDVPYQWHSFRLPKNANSDPIDNDYELKFPLEKHVDFIGMTGWDWRHKVSLRIGFDFDSITSHAKGVGLSDTDLLKVQEAFLQIPEALIIRSTSGKGLHVYFEFDPTNLPQTANHTEHAALAMACLKYISKVLNFDFQAKVDACGSILWVWARKITDTSFQVVKDNVGYLTPPSDWKSYLDVAERKRSRPKIEGAPEEEHQELESKADLQGKVELDLAHKEIIEELKAYAKYHTWWSSDYNLVQTHTRALKQLYEDRKALGKPLDGLFETSSEGNHPDKPNAFMFPLPNGAFRVYRFHKGTHEHASWRQEPGGWTYCYFNKNLSLEDAAAAFDGLEDTSKDGGYTFPDAVTALAAIRALGHGIALPEALANRSVTLRKNKQNKLIIETPKRKDDPEEIEGWLYRGKKWFKVFNITLETQQAGYNIEILDKEVRTIVTPGQKPCWTANMSNIGWGLVNKDDVRCMLRSEGYGTTQSEEVLGQLIKHPWKLVHVPFAPEFPGNRHWNFKAPVLKFNPQPFEPGNSMHPYWDMVLNHVGRDLDEHLKDLEWAKRNNIYTGRDYLLRWISCLIREPFEHLPYLFLWGGEVRGKSTLHEAIGLLMQGGVMMADIALTSASDFNGELAGAVLCVVEEKNIALNRGKVYSKIKFFITSPTIPIHAKGKEVFLQPNTTHWIQCAQTLDSCPVFSGDSRITVINVGPFDGEEIPPRELKKLLLEEAPYFMYTLMETPLPDVQHRLRLPVVETVSKQQLEILNQSFLDAFVQEQAVSKEGCVVSFEEFKNRFLAFLPEGERGFWSFNEIIKELPVEYPCGKINDIIYIGNLTFDLNEPKKDKLIRSKSGQLVGYKK